MYFSVKGSASMILSNEAAELIMHQKIEKDLKEALVLPTLSNTAALFIQSWLPSLGSESVNLFASQLVGNVIVDKADSMMGGGEFHLTKAAKMGGLVSAINVWAVNPMLKGVKFPGEVDATARQ